MSEKQLNHSARLIDSAHALNELTAGIAKSTTLALDTEFVRERTYYPELCLIQVATDSVIAAVDCRANVPMAAFYGALAGPDNRWVLHSSRQDLEILVQAGVALPNRLEDTQVAGALLGMTPQIGYAQLVADLIGTQLDKGHTRTDWRRRPISAAALEYAIDDVRYLLPVWHRLEAMLRERGRFDWFSEDCAALLTSFRNANLKWPWEKIKGARSLDQAGQSVARTLSSWRESQAARINRPRRWFISDEVLVALARGRPTSAAQLAEGYELSDKFRASYGTQLLEAIAAGEAAASQHRPLSNVGLSPAERQRLKRLGRAVTDRARDLELAAEVLATRQEMTDWMRGETPERLRHGWRAEVLADIEP